MGRLVGFILLSFFYLTSLNTVQGASMKILPTDTLTSIPMNAANETLLTPPQAIFIKGQNEVVWISDIEDVTLKKNDQLDLLVANKPYKKYLASGKLPAGKQFQLFPYHYLSKDYQSVTSSSINYRLFVKNETTGVLTLTIHGQGFALDWNHWRSWDGALKGQGSKVHVLQPNEELTLWEPKELKPELPYNAIILGQVNGGDLSVYDYCYINDDPGIEGCKELDDLAWAPTYDPAFIRGTADCFTATIKLDNADNALPVSKLMGGLKSVSFGYSPGGPITNLCEYKAVTPSFPDDTCVVTDSVSKKKHVFFGGNYPMIYNYRLPLLNDTGTPVEVNFYIASNDVFGVNSYVGVWMGDKALPFVAPAVKNGNRQHLWSLVLEPGELYHANMRIISLGSKWGGIIASIDVKTRTTTN